MTTSELGTVAQTLTCRPTVTKGDFVFVQATELAYAMLCCSL